MSQPSLSGTITSIPHKSRKSLLVILLTSAGETVNLGRWKAQTARRRARWFRVGLTPLLARRLAHVPRVLHAQRQSLILFFVDLFWRSLMRLLTALTPSFGAAKQAPNALRTRAPQCRDLRPLKYDQHQCFYRIFDARRPRRCRALSMCPHARHIALLKVCMPDWPDKDQFATDFAHSFCAYTQTSTCRATAVGTVSNDCRVHSHGEAGLFAPSEFPETGYLRRRTESRGVRLLRPK